MWGVSSSCIHFYIIFSKITSDKNIFWKKEVCLNWYGVTLCFFPEKNILIPNLMKKNNTCGQADDNFLFILIVNPDFTHTL